MIVNWETQVVLNERMFRDSHEVSLEQKEKRSISINLRVFWKFHLS